MKKKNPAAVALGLGGKLGTPAMAVEMKPEERSQAARCAVMRAAGKSGRRCNAIL